jgi:hypothetical protein
MAEAIKILKDCKTSEEYKIMSDLLNNVNYGRTWLIEE